MKKICILAFVCAIVGITKMHAYDFMARNANGDTIYYNYIGGDNVEVTYKDNNFNSYSGNIVIPSTVNNGTSSFQVTNIGGYAFNHCITLNSIEIPNSVTIIGTTAFTECYSLAFLNVDANNPNYCSIDSVLFSKDQTILIKCPATKHGAYSLPNTVSSIGYDAFAYCSNLTSIYIGSNVEEIKGDIFFACTKLNSIIVESTNQNYCSIDGILFNKDCTALKLFPGAREGKYVIPDGVACIDRYAFNYSKLTDVTVPNSITSIRSSAFYCCTRLNAIILPDNLTELETGAFTSCNNLMSINIPGKLTEIPSLAFAHCNNLQSVDLPKNISIIGDQAFFGCSKLDTVICRRKTPPLIGPDAFKSISETAVLYVPYDSIYEYQSISEYANHFAEIKGFSEVGAVSATTATLKWIPDTIVAQYDINVYTGGVPVAHYVVDGAGNIVSSQMFTPSIYQQKMDSTASTTDYYVISINGLTASTSYTYTIDGKDANNVPVYHEAGQFTTLSGEEGFFDALPDKQSSHARKFIKDGRLFILRGEEVYNVQGALVR